MLWRPSRTFSGTSHGLIREGGSVMQYTPETFFRVLKDLDNAPFYWVEGFQFVVGDVVCHALLLDEQRGLLS